MTTESTNGLNSIPQSIALIAKSSQLIQQAMNQDFYTEQQLSHKLCVSPRTLYRWRKIRWLGYTKLGKQVFYTHEEVMKMIRRFHTLPYVPSVRNILSQNNEKD